jgi:hypothetical protein
MDMTFGTWKVRRFYRAGSLKTVISELAKFNFELMAVQVVKWGKGGSQPAESCTFFCEHGNANQHLATAFFIYKKTIPRTKMVEIITDRMLTL